MVGICCKISARSPGGLRGGGLVSSVVDVNKLAALSVASFRRVNRSTAGFPRSRVSHRTAATGASAKVLNVRRLETVHARPSVLSFSSSSTMDTVKYSDAGHSGNLTDSSTSTIEMDILQDTSTPDHQLHHHLKHDDLPEEEAESEDELSGEDETSRALLPSRERPRGRERSRSPGPKTRIWKQVQRIVIETGPTLLLTTVGLLFTGELLNSVSRWKAMSRVDELIMIIPVILNLKGNLEMNLSARLGTAANIGELDKPAVRRAIILGNLTLLQVQAALVSFVAALVAFALGRIIPNPSMEQVMTETEDGSSSGPSIFLRHIFAARTMPQERRPRPSPLPKSNPSGLTEFMITASSSMLAACLSSALLGSFMCALVVGCRHFGLDPDNIAPPVAACLGDLVTLLLLGAVSTVNIVLVNTPVPWILLILVAGSAVGWTIVTQRNRHVKHLLLEGWVPLFAAMIISCGTGIVLDVFVSRYEGFALLAAVISGLPGNVGSIFVSRLSTALHAETFALTGLMPTSQDDLDKPPSPPSPSPKLVMITLICVTFPIEVAFLATLRTLGWLH
ncbi:hypothetical protein NM688_g8519 [Phlebia brevispora]|uniref:Uncharacterized protein n=1 Tax=Phlebia brevispora TaxID=194682 RepID=A0ACC1RQX5_9APHY|nr:hypothetical protein NM688_g8519 [Phlebia brevispora]